MVPVLNQPKRVGGAPSRRQELRRRATCGGGAGGAEELAAGRWLSLFSGGASVGAALPRVAFRCTS